VGAFLDERCRLASDARVAPSLLRAAYVTHCREEGVEPAPAPAFGAALETRFGAQGRGAKGKRYWAGVEVGP